MYFFVWFKITEDKTTNTSFHQESRNQSNGKRGRWIINSIPKESVRVNDGKFKVKSKARTQFKRKLIENRCFNQLILLYILESTHLLKDSGLKLLVTERIEREDNEE